MKIRSLALTLALGFALTGVSEAAKRKPVYTSKGQVARKANRAKFKSTKRKVTKLQVKHAKRK
jgi:hypothetical protein